MQRKSGATSQKGYEFPFWDKDHQPSYTRRMVPPGSHASAMSVTTTVYPSSSTMAAESRAVRFESQCVLIPEPQSQSLMHKLGKSFVLPLWKRSPEVELDSRGRILEERFGGRGGGHSHKYVSRFVPSHATEGESDIFYPVYLGTRICLLHPLGMTLRWFLV